MASLQDSNNCRSAPVFMDCMCDNLKVGHMVYPNYDSAKNDVVCTDANFNLRYCTPLYAPPSILTESVARWFNNAGTFEIIDSLVTLNNVGFMVVPTLEAGGILYPTIDGNNGDSLITNGTGVLSFVRRVESSSVPTTDNAIVRYDTTDGNIIQDSLASIDDTGKIIAPFLSIANIEYPTIDGTNAESIITDGAGNLSFSRRVESSSVPTTDNAIVRYDTTDGNIVQDSLVLIDDTGRITTPFLTSSGLSYPTTDGTNAESIITDGAGNLSFSRRVESSSGPTTDNAIVRFDTTDGNIVQDSLVSIDDTGRITTPFFTSSGLSYPTTDGTNAESIITDGAGNLSFSRRIESSSVPTTDNALVRYDTTDGNIVQDSLASIDDTGRITTPFLTSSGLSYPTTDGTNADSIITDGAGNLSFSRRVESSSVPTTNNSVPRFDTTDGNIIKDSAVTINNSGRLTTPLLTMSGMNFPSSNGLNGQVLTTDSTPNLFWGNPPTFGVTRLLSRINVQKTTNLGVGDHFVWDVIDFPATGTIDLDLTTPYTNLPNVDSIGRITLKKNKTYLLEAVIQNMNKSLNLEVAWWNVDASIQIGNSIINTQNTLLDPTINITVPAVIDTTGPDDVRVELRFIQADNVLNYNIGSLENQQITFTSVITPPFFFQVDRLICELSAPQIVNIAIGDHIDFDTQSFLNTTSFSLDTTTPYTNLPNVDSSGRITVGKSRYLLEAYAEFNNTLELAWWDVDNSVQIGQSILNGRYINTYLDTTAIIPTNLRIELRVISGTTTSIDRVFANLKVL